MTNTATLLALRNEVMQLVPGSFVPSGYPTALFIEPLLRGINAKAAKLHILALWLTPEERLLYHLDEVQLLVEPDLPPQNGNAQAYRAYQIHYDRWKAQRDALSELKHAIAEVGTVTIKDRLDEHVGGHNFGLQRLTLLQIKERILNLFGQASLKDLATFRGYLDSQWTPETDFLEFLSNFNDIMNFLERTGQRMSSSESVLKLIDAVKHFPSFQTATQMFFVQYPTPAVQTLDNLMSVYRHHYNTSYSDLSAKTMGLVHQVTLNEPSTDEITAMVINEVRKEIGNGTMPKDTQHRVVEAIRTALKPPTNTRQDKRRQRSDDNIPCPVHTHGKHTWKECRQNPKNVPRK